ncbi:MAG: hypothetical protein ACP5JB_06990 [candidate division WOR-3 bacterium]|jgi:hypothetical protein
MKLKFALLALLMPVFFTAAGAQSFRLPEWVIDEGGVKATGGNYIGYGSFHQTTIGYATGGNFIAWIGYWHPRMRNVYYDVAAVEIVSPNGAVDTINEITPRALVANYGSGTVNFLAIFSIRIAGGVTPIYQNGKPVQLGPGEQTVVDFVPVRLRSLGPHIARCSVALARDENPANDTVSRLFKVLARPPWPEGWIEVQSMPTIPSGRGVSSGGFLVIDQNSGLIYAAKGNKCPDFYRYDPISNNWDTLAPWPDGREGKKPAKGATGCSDNSGFVYAVKGNNTLGFWRYNSFWNEWEQLPDVPYEPGNRKIKGGADMVFVVDGGVPYVYLLKGQRNDFYRFNALTYQWEVLTSPPGITKWDRGSWLVYDGETRIYAHKAKYHEFYFYDLTVHDWWPEPLAGMPYTSPRMQSRKRSRDGGCATWAYGSIFALKGGNTCELWRYLPEGDSWTEADTMPSFGSTGKRKRVKDGGDIASYGDAALFALKGNKTCEVWRYVPGAEIVQPQPPERSGAMGSAVKFPAPGIAVMTPLRPGMLTVRYALGGSPLALLELVDAAGRLVHRQVVGGPAGVVNINSAAISRGVYFVRLCAPAIQLKAKVTVVP